MSIVEMRLSGPAKLISVLFLEFAKTGKYETTVDKGVLILKRESDPNDPDDVMGYITRAELKALGAIGLKVEILKDGRILK